MPLPAFIHSSATISECRRYRYTLKRVWDAELPVCTFIMFNPSTADAEVLDRTISRCVNFAIRENCGALLVLNVFSLRSPYPNDVRAAGHEAIGPENDETISAELEKAEGPVIAAWGGFRWARERIEAVREIIGERQILCLGLNNDGTPCHPLYRPHDTVLQVLP